MEAQAQTFNQLENTFKDLRARVDLLTEMVNSLSKKKDKEGGEREIQGDIEYKRLG